MNLRLTKTRNTLLFILLAMPALTACGIKGDLYLPEDKQASTDNLSLSA